MVTQKRMPEWRCRWRFKPAAKFWCRLQEATRVIQKGWVSQAILVDFHELYDELSLLYILTTPGPECCTRLELRTKFTKRDKNAKSRFFVVTSKPFTVLPCASGLNGRRKPIYYKRHRSKKLTSKRGGFLLWGWKPGFWQLPITFMPWCGVNMKYPTYETKFDISRVNLHRQNWRTTDHYTMCTTHAGVTFFSCGIQTKRITMETAKYITPKYIIINLAQNSGFTWILSKLAI